MLLPKHQFNRNGTTRKFTMAEDNWQKMSDSSPAASNELIGSYSGPEVRLEDIARSGWRLPAIENEWRRIQKLQQSQGGTVSTKCGSAVCVGRHFGLLGTALAVIRSFLLPHKVWIASAVGKQICDSNSEPPGAVELILFFWIVHFGIEINLRNLKGFVAEPGLDLH